ncbi:hypothetical protein EDB82DRAFT_574950 [Fusarium venenatum]|uniref:uncharacterized protein n=1 Tax=Fusarium venenatum TaxID=56646 RepID=UPI001D669D6E|nr:hypothetical protein EDB82DRAFT_574950 [Fusarium venenatum]
MCVESSFCNLCSEQDEHSAQAFTLFPLFPPEIRLLIWEAALPSPHEDSHTAYNIWASSWRERKNIKLPGKKEAPASLLRACSESRDVALTTGSFLELSHMSCSMIPRPRFEPIWIEKRIKTLMMPIHVSALSKINYFPKSIQSIAMLATLHSDTAVVSIDDPKMLDYLTSAFERHAVMTLGERLSPECYRKSARNFLVLARLMERILYSREQRLVPNGFELKAAIIFGRPHFSRCLPFERCVRIIDGLVCRSEDEADLEDWSSGIELIERLPRQSSLIGDEIIRGLIQQ